MQNAKTLWNKTKDLATGKPPIQGDTMEEVWALKDVSFDIRREENILWSFAPHDISIILSLAGEINTSMPDYVAMKAINALNEHGKPVRRAERNLPAVKKLTSWPSMDEIVSAVKMELGENGDLTRKVSIFFCRKYSGAKLKEIGERFGIRDAAVSQASWRLELKAGRRSAIEDDDKQAGGCTGRCQMLRPAPSRLLGSGTVKDKEGK